jgi:hypothetical protein
MFNKFFRPKSDYKFDLPKNTACFVCNHVLNKERPILLVSHDEADSNWQFLCGKNDHDDQSIRIISLEEVTELDNSINDLFDLPEGVTAERVDIGLTWTPYKSTD